MFLISLTNQISWAPSFQYPEMAVAVSPVAEPWSFAVMVSVPAKFPWRFTEETSRQPDHPLVVMFHLPRIEVRTDIGFLLPCSQVASARLRSIAATPYAIEQVFL